MKKISFIIFLLVFNNIFIDQDSIENIIHSDFTIRDFIVEKDSVFYIKKRNLYHHINNQSKPDSKRFVGGYGLKVFKNKKNELITVSNELVENVSSIRYFEKNKNQPKHVFYNYEGKILDAVIIPDKKLIALSLITSKIIFIDYSKKPKFVKIAEIKMDALSRKIRYIGENLFFATDNGGFYKYDIGTYEKNKIFQDKGIITDFIIEDDGMFYSNINGEIKKIDFKSEKRDVFTVKGSFITTLLSNEKELICGSWNGEILIIDKKTLKPSKRKKIHSKAILKTYKQKNDDEVFYSSSIDKTIKMWNHSKF